MRAEIVLRDEETPKVLVMLLNWLAARCKRHSKPQAEAWTYGARAL